MVRQLLKCSCLRHACKQLGRHCLRRIDGRKDQLIRLLEAGGDGLTIAHTGLELPARQRFLDGVHDSRVGIGWLPGNAAQLALMGDFKQEGNLGCEPIREPFGLDGRSCVAAQLGLLIQLAQRSAFCAC